MPDSAQLADFHFLRPWWLLLVPLAFVLHFQLRRAFSVADQWQGEIAEHLIKHLSVGSEGQRLIRPYQALTVFFVLAGIALAGPAWQKEVTPFTEDRAPLVIALKLTDSMLAVDQQPTRLTRAKQKLRDLLERRQGARTAVIAYAGSAHAVLPLTDDAQLLDIYVEALEPLVMPQQGDAPEKALRLAESLLADESTDGTVLFMGDGIDRTYATVFQSHTSTLPDQLMFWAFGTETGGPIEETGDVAPGTDFAGLDAVANAANANVIRATVDTSDVDQVVRDVQTNLVNAIEADENLRWHDAGYYFVWPLAFLALIWSRRGWTVVWA